MKRRFLIALAPLLATTSCDNGVPPRSPPRELAPAPAPSPAADLRIDRPAHTGPRGETAALVKGALVITRSGGASISVAPDDLHAPPGDRSLYGIWPRELLYLDDGTLLVGSADGTITAIDDTGHRRFVLGFRGPIRGMARAEGNVAVVTTGRGVVSLVTSWAAS